MRNFHGFLSNTPSYRLVTFTAIVSLLCVLAPLSRANAPAMTLSVVNNSQKEIRHLFLASSGTDKWGDDQLSEPIATGASRNINASWSEATVKVIAEDEDGCFLTATLDTAESPNWTITTSTPRNCGN